MNGIWYDIAEWRGAEGRAALLAGSSPGARCGGGRLKRHSALWRPQPWNLIPDAGQSSIHFPFALTPQHTTCDTCNATHTFVSGLVIATPCMQMTACQPSLVTLSFHMQMTTFQSSLVTFSFQTQMTAFQSSLVTLSFLMRMVAGFVTLHHIHVSLGPLHSVVQRFQFQQD